MLKCLDCDYVCEQAARCAEYWGQCHGRPTYTYSACCPRCGGEVQEIEE